MSNPKKGVEYIFDIPLVNASARPAFKAAPTLEAGDVKISKDNGAFVNLATLPTVTPAGGVSVKVTVSATEMTVSRATITFIDQTTPEEWDDVIRYIDTSTVTVDDLVRSVTPENALNVDSNNRAESLLGAVTHTGAVVPTVTTLTNKTGFSLAATGLDLILATATGAIEIAKAIWDRVLTGATHNIPSSAGRRVRQSAGIVMDDGTAQAGGVNNITLAAGASATDGIYWQSYLAIVGGTGAGQGHHIVAYNGTTKVATMDDDWVEQPDNTSDYIIYGSGSHEAIEEGTPTAVTNNTITLNPYSPDADGQLVPNLISIISGTGNRQVRRIVGYNGTTKVVVIDRPWITNPDTSSGYWIWQNDNTAAKIDRNADLIESQRGSHTWQGNTWYVAPTTGSDTTGDGSRDLPFATVTKAHAEATDNNHDVIFLLADNVAGVTTLTEQVTISKNYLFIRGPGRDFFWDYNANGDVITVAGAGVELSGFVLSTYILGSGDGVYISGDFCKVHHVWLEYARQYGIYIDNADWCQIHDNTIHGCGKDAASSGVYVFQSGGGTALHNTIQHNSIDDNIGAGVETSGIVEDTVIKHNNIHGSSTYGVIIGATGLTNGIYDNTFSDNATGNINDAGTGTYKENNEPWAKHSIATEARLAELDTGNLPADIDSLLVGINILLAGVTVTDAGGNKIADHVLRRAFATAAASSDGDTKAFRSLLGAVAKLTNKVAVVGADLKTYEADDTTELGSQALVTDPNAEPIISLDTA